MPLVSMETVIMTFVAFV